MKSMKKVLALVLAILLMCSFCMIAACGKDKPNPKPPIDNPGGDEYEVLEFSDGDTVVLKPGAMRTLKVKNNTDVLTFESSNKEVAEIDETDQDLLIVRKVGTTDVTAKKDGATVATLTVNSTQPVSGVSLNKQSASLLKNGTIQLSATVMPDTASNKNITWSSSDNTVATVSDTGLVTGLKAGKASIVVTTEDGAFNAVCAITVLELAQSLNGWTSTARDGSVASVGLTEDEEKAGYTSFMHTAATQDSIAYHEKAFDATKGLKLTFDYTEPCTDGGSWIMITFATAAPSWVGDAKEGTGFRFIIRNVSENVIQVQGDMVDSQGWAEGGAAPVYSEQQSVHATLFPVLDGGNGIGKKGLTAELVKRQEGGYQVVVANLSNENYTMTWDLNDEVVGAWEDLSDVYVSVQFSISSAPYAPLGRADIKLEGTPAKAITDVAFADEEVEKFSNDAEFTVIPGTQPSDLAPVFIWSSSDPSVATVDETGKVTLTGKTSSGIYITAKAMNGAVSDSYKLIVKPNILKINPTHTYGDDVLYVLSGAPLTEFTKDGGSACVSGTELSMEVGFRGKAYVYFYKMSDLTLIVGYEYSDWSKAIDGVASLGDKTIEPPETVHVTEIQLNKTSVLVGLTETAPVLITTVLPVNATDKTVTWESSDPDIVAVNAETGALTLVAAGTATITVKAADGNVQAQCSITVSEDYTAFETWTGSNGIMFSKDSVSANDFIFKYTTQNSTAVNGIAKNSAAYAFKGDNASLKFKLKWMDNYLQNAKLNWVGFCFTNARGEGFAAKYVKFQSGTNAGLHMTVMDTADFTGVYGDEINYEQVEGSGAPSDFFYANEEAAYVDFSITRTADGIKLVNTIEGNPWYTNQYLLTEEQAAKLGDELYLSVIIQSDGTVTSLDYGQISVKK